MLHVEAVGDCKVGSGVALETIANAGRQGRIVLYGKTGSWRPRNNVPENAAITLGSRVVPGHTPGIEVAEDDEVVLMRLCEFGLRDEKRCGALLGGRYTLEDK